MAGIKSWVIDKTYANHGNSPRVTKALERCVSALRPAGFALNIGSSSTWHRERIINLDLHPGSGVDCVGDAHRLPFRNESLQLVITQETLEHVANPDVAMMEIFRVLAPGGFLYCQLPFVIGYHPGPTDFWRFTREGIRELAERSGFEVLELSQSVGPAFGFHRIATEFWAVLIARFVPRAYLLAKGFFSILFYPVKWFDGLLVKSPQADRIAGGYYLIAQKSGSAPPLKPASLS